MTTDDGEDVNDEETQQITLRLPVPLLQRIKHHADRMKRAAPGRLTVARADAIRALLVDALDAIETKDALKPKKISKL
jgi:hypothetical protein